MKEIILRADRSDDPEVRKSMVASGLETGFTSFILRSGDEGLERLGRMETMYFSNGEPEDEGIVQARIDGPGSLGRIRSLAGRAGTVIVTSADWKVIPLEDLVSRFHGTGTKLLAVAKNIEDLTLYLNVLEEGTDGVVVDIDVPEEIPLFSEAMSSASKLHLSVLRVISVRPVGVGDRVCVDTCSVMVPGEGMLVGSFSDCLFLVQSESEDNGYVGTRPFRVNAGAVHSYAMVDGDETKYLSEISGGDTVLICDREGNTELASVGRCKIERRPLLMVTATDGENRYSAILQNAETVRLVGEEGSIPVTELKEGDKVFAKLSSGGRHLGRSVNETISEK